MATATQIKELLKTHGEGNDERFYAIALQVASSEARKGHQKLAEDLRRLVEKAKMRKREGGLDTRILHLAQPLGEAAELLEEVTDHRRLNDVVMDAALAERMRRILSEQQHLSRIRSAGLTPRNKLLFTGPPGCGKTLMAGALANELGLPFFVVRLDTLITRYLGESLSKLRLIFDAVNSSRAVYLFDEFDSIGYMREATNDVGEMRRVLNGFLMQIEKLQSDSLVIAATNFAGKLDRALFRRFDDLVEFGLPGDQEIWLTIQQLVSGFATGRLSKKELCEAAQGLSYAEVTRACEETVKEMIITQSHRITNGMLINALTERRLFSKH
ncbi:AAA family ATPase [Kiritimatiellota bacterium B12222]|nr:AAA family ATPase [Kiritimatiellota bacterium B12222]